MLYDSLQIVFRQRPSRQWRRLDYWLALSNHCADGVEPCSHTPQWTLGLSVIVNVNGNWGKKNGSCLLGDGHGRRILLPPLQRLRLYIQCSLRPHSLLLKPLLWSFGDAASLLSVASIHDGTCTDAESCEDYYRTRLGTKSLAHGSVSYETYQNFDGGDRGSFIVYLRAMDCTKRTVLVETFIQMLVGEMNPTWNVKKLPKRTIVEEAPMRKVLPVLRRLYSYCIFCPRSFFLWYRLGPLGLLVHSKAGCLLSRKKASCLSLTVRRQPSILNSQLTALILLRLALLVQAWRYILMAFSGLPSAISVVAFAIKCLALAMSAEFAPTATAL